MYTSIEVIPYTIEKTIRDQYGRITERAGDVVVCHGVDHDTGKNVCLPCEPFRRFVDEHCVRVGGAYFLKE